MEMLPAEEEHILHDNYRETGSSRSALATAFRSFLFLFPHCRGTSFFHSRRVLPASLRQNFLRVRAIVIFFVGCNNDRSKMSCDWVWRRNWLEKCYSHLNLCRFSSEKPFCPNLAAPHNGISFRFRGSLILIHYLHNTEAISRSAPLSSFIFELLFYSRLPFDAKIINLDGFRYSWTRFSRFFLGKNLGVSHHQLALFLHKSTFFIFFIAWSHRMHPTRPSLINYGIEKLRRSFPLLHKSLSMKPPRLRNLRKCMLLRNGAGH